MFCLQFLLRLFTVSFLQRVSALSLIESSCLNHTYLQQQSAEEVNETDPINFSLGFQLVRYVCSSSIHVLSWFWEFLLLCVFGCFWCLGSCVLVLIIEYDIRLWEFGRLVVNFNISMLNYCFLCNHFCQLLRQVFVGSTHTKKESILPCSNKFCRKERKKGFFCSFWVSLLMPSW